MTDRETVVKGLEGVLDWLSEGDDRKCVAAYRAVEDALELLKEQEFAKDTNVPNKWISVKDKLPKSVTNKVLVWLEHEDLNGYIGFGHYEKYKGQEIWFDLEHSEPFSIRGYIVTHWMPLPEPPEEDEA